MTAVPGEQEGAAKGTWCSVDIRVKQSGDESEFGRTDKGETNSRLSRCTSS